VVGYAASSRQPLRSQSSGQPSTVVVEGHQRLAVTKAAKLDKVRWLGNGQGSPRCDRNAELFGELLEPAERRIENLDRSERTDPRFAWWDGHRPGPKRFFEQRLAGLEDRPRRDRPPAFRHGYALR
jgi:hypothetical protein